MRILVAGIGGIGGLIASSLVKGGGDVTLLARGRALARLQEQGLRIVSGDREETFRAPVIEQPHRGETFDAIFICCKAQDFPALAASLKGAMTAQTGVIAGVNGLPWWFLEGAECNGRALHLQLLDPSGLAREALKGVTPVGVVVHASAQAIEPGVVKIIKADRLIFGDPPGHAFVHTHALAAMCQAGGLASPVTPSIREEIWAKLWGNQNMNPVSALTRLTATPILETPELRQIVLDMMQEFDRVGRAIGLRLPMSADERIEVTKVLGDFRTSMLNDAEAGRRLEHEAILGSFVELASQCNVPAPVSKLVYALLKGLDLALERKRLS